MAKSRLQQWLLGVEMEVRQKYLGDGPPSVEELDGIYRAESQADRANILGAPNSLNDGVPNLTLVVPASLDFVPPIGDRRGHIQRAQQISGGVFVDPGSWLKIAAKPSLEQRFGHAWTREMMGPAVDYCVGRQVAGLVANGANIVREVPPHAEIGEVQQLLSLPNRTQGGREVPAPHQVVVYAVVLTRDEQVYMRAAHHVEQARDSGVAERYRREPPEFEPYAVLEEFLTPERLEYAKVGALLELAAQEGRLVNRVVLADSRGKVLADSVDRPDLLLSLHAAAARTQVIAAEMGRSSSREEYAVISAGWANLWLRTTQNPLLLEQGFLPQLEAAWTEFDTKSGVVPPVVLPEQGYYLSLVKPLVTQLLDRVPAVSTPADHRTLVAVVGPSDVDLGLATAAAIDRLALLGNAQFGSLQLNDGQSGGAQPANREAGAALAPVVKLDLADFAKLDPWYPVLQQRYGHRAAVDALQIDASNFMNVVTARTLCHADAVVTYSGPLSAQRFNYAFPTTINALEMQLTESGPMSGVVQRTLPQLQTQLLVVVPGDAVQQVNQFEAYVRELAEAREGNRGSQPSRLHSMGEAGVARLVGMMVAAQSKGAEVIPVNERGEPLLDQQQTQQLQAQLKGLAAERAARIEQDSSNVGWDFSSSADYEVVAGMVTSLQGRPLSVAELTGLAGRMKNATQNLQAEEAFPPIIVVAKKLEKDLNKKLSKALAEVAVEAEHKAVVARETFYRKVVRPALSEIGAPAIPLRPPIAGSAPGAGPDSAAAATPSASTPIHATPSIHFIVGPPGAILDPAIATAATNLTEQGTGRTPIILSREALRALYQRQQLTAAPAKIKATVDHCFQRALEDLAEGVGKTGGRSAVIDLTGVSPQEIPSLVRPFTERNAQGAVVTVAVHVPTVGQITQADFTDCWRKIFENSGNGVEESTPFKTRTESDIAKALQGTVTALAGLPNLELTFIDATGALKVLEVPPTSPTLQPDSTAPTIADPSVPTPTHIGQPLNTTANPALRATLTNPSACQGLLQALQQTRLTPKEQAIELDLWESLANYVKDKDMPKPVKDAIYDEIPKSAEQVGRNPAAQDAYIKQKHGVDAAERESKRTIAMILEGPPAVERTASLNSQSTEIRAEAIKNQKLLAVGPLHAAVETGNKTYSLVALRELREQGIALPEVGQTFTGPAKAKEAPEHGPSR